MRVLIFVDDLSATGVVNNAIAIAGALSARGADVRLVAARAEGTLKATIASDIEIVGLLDRGAAGPRSLRQLRAIRAYRRYARQVRPDVIFSAGNHAHIASAIAATAVPEARLILRISNDLEHAKGRGPLRRLKRWWRAANFRRIAGRAGRMIFVSRHLQEQADAITDAAAKSVVIPNGVDVEAIRKLAIEDCPHPWLGTGDGLPVVVAVGRLVKQKNFINLVRAIASAARPMRLVLIGSGPLRETIIGAARKHGIADAIDIVDSTPNPIAYMARAAAVALPSWWEGSSNVLLEAVACGTAVVASRTAGNADEVVDGGRYGVLVDPADVQALSRALDQQCGPSRVLPGDRADAFSRAAMLDAYADLILGGTA